MKVIFYILLLLYSNVIFANQESEEVIELHENKSLDQMVLDQIESIDDENNQSSNIINNEIEQAEIEDIETEEQIDETIISDIEIKISNNLWNDVDKTYVDNILLNSNNLISNILQNEFNDFLYNLNLDYELEKNKEIRNAIIRYFYNIGNISKAYSLIQAYDLQDDKNLSFYNSIKINYLLSTFQLEEACNLNEEIKLQGEANDTLIYKVEIFCLILENKLSEAELLNSIMLETDNDTDLDFQYLFLFLSNNQTVENLDHVLFSKEINSDLIFLYSSMARMAELPLNEQFLENDSTNIAIPIILNKSTPMELRINAANKSFVEGYLSVESLGALYQSVDFNSKELNNPDETINKLSGKVDLLMPYYFQLINVQIFPSDRLKALMSFWDFAKDHDLEYIAYSLSYKILDSFEITSDYLKYSPQIAQSYVYNKDYEKAQAWINFYEETNEVDEKSSLVRILLNLYTSDEVSSIVEIINNNFEIISNSTSTENEELIYTLFEVLDKNQNKELNYNFENIFDNRLMPSIFVTENIKNAILNSNDAQFLVYSIISMNKKNWKDIHPNHLKLILEGFINYKNGEIIKNIVLEIFEDYKIL